MPFVILLPAISLAGLIVLTVFIYRLIQAVNTGAPLELYPVKLGVPSLVVFLSLVLQRLLPMALLFLVAVLIIVAIIVIYARVNAKSATTKLTVHVKAAPLISLEKYTKHIRENALLKRVLKLQSIVSSIRSVVGYNEKTLPEQSADIRKMETIYLPKIEGLLNQYLKVASHDKGYDSRRLMENLDTITQGIRQIHAACLDQDKLSLDVEASALISAMELDGLGKNENNIRHHIKD